MKILYSFCAVILNYLGSPLFWVTTLGPILQGINLAWLRNKLNIPYQGIASEKVSSNVNCDDLKIILDTQWGYALNDFNTQEFVVLLTIVLMFFTLIGKFLEINLDGEQFGFRPVSLPKSRHNLPIFTLTLIVSVLGLIFLMSGTFAEPEYIKLYLPNHGIMDGAFRMPPLNSPLTWFRGILILIGIYFSYWSNLISKMREIP